MWDPRFLYVNPQFNDYARKVDLYIDFFTFSLIAFSFFPLVTRQLGDSPRAVEKLTRGYLAILAICDVSLLPLVEWRPTLIARYNSMLVCPDLG